MAGPVLYGSHHDVPSLEPGSLAARRATRPSSSATPHHRHSLTALSAIRRIPSQCLSLTRPRRVEPRASSLGLQRRSLDLTRAWSTSIVPLFASPSRQSGTRLGLKSSLPLRPPAACFDFVALTGFGAPAPKMRARGLGGSDLVYWVPRLTGLAKQKEIPSCST